MNISEEENTDKTYIGIDIGKSGAIAIRTGNGSINIFAMPLIGKELDFHELNQILRPYKGTYCTVVFEKMIPFISNKQTTFSLGQQCGAIEMVCVALSIPYSKTVPANWQKDMFLGVENMTKISTTNKSGTTRDTKAMALMAIKRLFPELKLTFGDKTKKPDDNLIDAVLIMEWAKRKKL